MTFDELDKIVVEESQYGEVLLVTECTVVKVVRVSGSEWRIVVCKNFSKKGVMWGIDHARTITEPTTSEMLEEIKIALKHAGVNQDISITTE